MTQLIQNLAATAAESAERKRERASAHKARERERMCDQEGNLAQWLIADSTCAVSCFSATRLGGSSQTMRIKREREHVQRAVLARPDWAVLAKLCKEKEREHVRGAVSVRPDWAVLAKVGAEKEREIKCAHRERDKERVCTRRGKDFLSVQEQRLCQDLQNLTR